MTVLKEKRNFAVSFSPKAWVPEASGFFFAEPHTYHYIERQGLAHQFQNVRIAAFLRCTHEDMRRDRDFVFEKYEQYLNVLYQRLNAIHQTNHSKVFWKRALGVGLTRHITLLYEFFKVCEHWFDPDRHVCKILSPDCYYTPLDYDDNRWLIQHGVFGQEQLLSEYLNLFHPGACAFYQDRYVSNYRVNGGDHFAPNQPKVGIMRALFSREHMHDLVARSRGEINSVGFNRRFEVYDGRLVPEARDFLSKLPENADRFDTFFFSSLPRLFPKVFIEYFKHVHDTIAVQLNHYTRLRYVVSEFWLGETYEALALAILHNRGVKHIYNEHNYDEHPGYANTHSHLASFVDVFAAHGNYETEYPTSNIVPVGSLFEWTVKTDVPKAHKILYVTIKPGANLCYFTSASEEKENAIRHFDFIKAFFNHLSAETIKQIHYRGYPVDDWSRCCTLCYDDLFFVKDLIKGAAFDNLTMSAKQVMARSELVVVDYISTSHLEAMSMNIPTIFFFRTDSWALNKANEHMFQEVLSVGIAQSNPVKAAQFVEEIKDNPLAWWNRADVQAAKDRFLARNLGKPELMKEYLLKLAAE